ncbi:MAG: type IV pilus modification protein PilV [Kangiellaceae bacterium]|nr:type IV pilus modification protein PilV [Kangiellaceae bacterium]
MIKGKHQNGFSLLEALITLLIVSIGLLGYAALQIGALNSSVDSFSRTQATMILEDAVSRIRNNKEYLKTDSGAENAYVNNVASGTFYAWCDIENSLIPEAACTSGASCSMNLLAQQDIFEVCSSVVNTKLPTAIMGAACFDRDTSVGDSDNCSVGSRMSLYLAWKGVERKDISGKTEYQQNTRCQTEVGLGSDYACVQLEIVP